MTSFKLQAPCSHEAHEHCHCVGSRISSGFPSDDAAKNLRGESAVGVPEKEQDVTAQKESTDEEVGAVLAELDTSAEATEGVDEQERAARVCKRWVTCTNGFFGNIRCSGGKHCTLWQR